MCALPADNPQPPHSRLRLVYWLLPALPAALAVRLVPAWHQDTLLFLFACLAIIPLAALMALATDQLAERAGPNLGGLINASFGNAPELIIAIMALSKGLTGVVKATITGSIVGNILLVLGAVIVAAGFRSPRLTFNRTGASAAATSLSLAVIGLAIPTIFHVAVSRSTTPLPSGAEQHLSLAIACVLLAIYLSWLMFSLLTHRHIFVRETLETVQESWSLLQSILVLGLATILITVMSEFLASSIEPTCKSLGLSDIFVGVIIMAIIGNAGEHSTAVSAALMNKIDLSLSICIGSSLQIALFITPLLVFASYLMGSPMTLEFSLPEIATIGLSVWIVGLICGDGEFNWLEGVQLLAAYLVIAILFYFLP